MKPKRLFFKLSSVTLAFAMVIALTILLPGVMLGQKAQSIGVPDDWTHHSLIFSNPGSFEQAIRNGTFETWYRIVTDPRFNLQQIKQNTAAQRPGDQLAIEAAKVTVHTPKERLDRDWSENLGTNAKVGADQYPAKFSFFTSTANCGNATQPDYVVFNTSLAGSASQASIVAYDNLYSGCTGTVPSVYWAYNTGGTISTSVVLSGDGSQVAFVHTNPSTTGVASLVLLKWKAGTGTVTSPATPTSVTAANYPTCTAPCMTTIPFSGGTTHNDSNSSPFYVYFSDVLYVGDDVGSLHKFTGVFLGTPAEAGSPWPVLVSNNSQPLTSPVFDSAHGTIFVGDRFHNDHHGGSLYRIFPDGTGLTASDTVAGSPSNGTGVGFVDAPLVDGAAGMVYAFTPSDATATNSAVFQFPVNFASLATGTEAHVGAFHATNPMYSGAFDNIYFTSVTPSTPTGHLYVCGNAGGAPTLYQISIAANVMSTTVVTGPTVSSVSASTCSPVTEFFNGGTLKDHIYLSPQTESTTAVPTGCSNNTGCLIAYDVTTGVITTLTTPSSAAPEAGGTSGIIIDNSSNFAGASQIYFSTLSNQGCPTSGGTGGCAIQLSQ